MNNKEYRFSLRKLKTGLGSVLVGLLFLGNTLSVVNTAKADQPNINLEKTQVADFSRETEDGQKTVKTIWTNGVSNLDLNSFKDNGDVLHYTYQQNQGWYDITKKFDGRDNLLCGAATAGNMLHWWFDQNKDQIVKYFNEHPEKAKLMFKDDLLLDVKKAIDTKGDQMNSELFQFFRDKAFPTISKRNLGVMPDRVIDMFINGYRLGLSKSLEETDINDPRQDVRGGVFDKVFNMGDASKKMTNRYDLNHLNIEQVGNLINKQLNEGKALALSHTYASVRMAHVINLWGADFDNEGKIKAIYVTDSDTDKNVGMKKYYIDTNSQGSVSISAKEIGPDNPGAQVIGLFTLSSGKDMWPAQY